MQALFLLRNPGVAPQNPDSAAQFVGSTFSPAAIADVVLGHPQRLVAELLLGLADVAGFLPASSQG
jgi:hypothetical protein